MANQPKDPLETLQREVERLFHDLVYRRHPATHFAEPAWAPPADLVVSPQDARVLLELAGVPRESIQVRVRGRLREVSGRREPPQEPAGAHYHRAEIYFGEFRRVVELPWDADSSRVEAQFKDGMLSVRLWRAPVPEVTEVAVEEPGGASKAKPREGPR
ncbi:MAG TPA: Hsp20/alpha crystallin family protein [Candidatus Eisenbacteria bacterium]